MHVDPRGQRFAALISTVVLALVLITGSGWLLAAQAAVFAVGAVFGLTYAPYGLLFRGLVQRRVLRLGRPAELEPAGPPRFAQAVGLVISLIGVAGYAAGVTPLGMAATAAALAAAFLNAAFGYCLGCQIYLLIREFWPGRRFSREGPPVNKDKEVPA
jgi:Domain of unknown function (DUF4395)